LQAVARLRQYEEESGAKRQLVIAVSANFTSRDHNDMVGYSTFDAVIPKPFSVPDIKSTIADCIAGRTPMKPEKKIEQKVSSV
jgi:CheY-like chemotaxis protein